MLAGIPPLYVHTRGISKYYTVKTWVCYAHQFPCTLAGVPSVGVQSTPTWSEQHTLLWCVNISVRSTLIKCPRHTTEQINQVSWGCTCAVRHKGIK